MEGQASNVRVCLFCIQLGDHMEKSDGKNPKGGQMGRKGVKKGSKLFFEFFIKNGSKSKDFSDFCSEVKAI